MQRVQVGGAVVRGRRLASGYSVPDRYASILETSQRPRDPAAGVRSAPPNLGRNVIPHMMTFRSVTSTLSKAYVRSDEALRHSQENADAMRLHPIIMGPLLARQQMVALLNWSIESEDDKDPRLKAAAERLAAIIGRTPFFTEYRRSLMEAIWYGRTCNQHAYGHHLNRHGDHAYVISHWEPIHGDKLLFRFDDGKYKFAPNQIGVKVYGGMRDDALAGRRELEATTEGLGYFFQPWERKQLVVHKHWVMDAPFQDVRQAGAVHGVGLRHFIYWTFYQMIETLAQIAEIIDQTGLGVTLYYYPTGNEEYRKDMEKAAKERAHTNVLLIPHDPNEMPGEPIQVLPPNTQGLEVLRSIVEDWFGDQILRFIMGSTLMMKSEPTGIGAGAAPQHEQMVMQNIRYDATGLEETITHELVLPCRNINLPKYRTADFHFRISTEAAATEDQLRSIREAWDMGATVKARDVFEKIGLSMPDRDDVTLSNPMIRIQELQIKQSEQQEAMGGGAPGAPDGGDEDAAAAMGDESLEGMAPHEAMSALAGQYSKRDSLRQRIEAAAARTARNPSDAQRDAGNYTKGRVGLHGLTVAIETPRGKRRRPEWPPLTAHYGQILGHRRDRDGDLVNVFIGPVPESELVAIVDQLDENGGFDEHKVVIGCTSLKGAKDLYTSNYTQGWRVGPVSVVTMSEFRRWLREGDLSRPYDAKFPKPPSYTVQPYRKSTQRLRYAMGRAFEAWQDDGAPDHPPTIAVDLDGTLAEYDGFSEAIGDPRTGAREAMQILRDAGWQVVIWTSRGDIAEIRSWLMKHDIPYDGINENPFQPDGTSDKIVADYYLDDRAVRADSDDLVADVAGILEREAANRIDSVVVVSV